MPGKVNPTQCEAMTMVATQIMGNDTAVPCSQPRPLRTQRFQTIVITIIESVKLLSDASRSFRINCIEGLQPHRDNIEKHLKSSHARDSSEPNYGL